MVLCLLLVFGGRFRLVIYFDSEIVRSLSAYFRKTRSEIGYGDRELHIYPYLTHTIFFIDLLLFPVRCTTENLTIDSGSYHLSTNGSMTQSEFSCTENYHIYGNPKLYCTTNGTWDSDVPKCGRLYYNLLFSSWEAKFTVNSKIFRIYFAQLHEHLCTHKVFTELRCSRHALTCILLFNAVKTDTKLEPVVPYRMFY